MPSRFLKESITTSDTIEQLSDAEEAFFYRLIVICDDFGRFDARAPILKARLYPLRTDRLSDEEIVKRLQALVDAGLVYVYEQNGHIFLQMVTWKDHQQVRATKSRYPDPESPDSKCYQLLSDSSKCTRTRTRTRTRNTYIPADGAVSVETAVSELVGDNGKSLWPKTATRNQYPEEFERLWQEYGSTATSDKKKTYENIRKIMSEPIHPTIDQLIEAGKRHQREAEATGWRHMQTAPTFYSYIHKPYEPFIGDDYIEPVSSSRHDAPALNLDYED